MNTKSLYTFILLILLLKINHFNSTFNFTFTIVNELIRGTFISPTIGEDGSLYIITGYDIEPSSDQYSRYYIKYNINTLSRELNVRIKNLPSFYSGEAFAFFENNKQYLFIPTSTESPGIGAFEIRNAELMSGEGITWQDSTIYGYRRSFKKAGSYFYFMNLGLDKKSLLIKKMKISSYQNNIPVFDLVKYNNDIQVISQPMISCDFTYNNNYILCAYHSLEDIITVSIFDTNLVLKSTKKYETIKSTNSVDFLKYYI